MGRKEVEFEVERRRDRTPVKDLDVSKKDEKRDTKDSDKAPSESENWLDSPRMMENMKYFVFAQSFVIFLTYGLPRMQQGWALLMELFK